VNKHEFYGTCCDLVLYFNFSNLKYSVCVIYIHYMIRFRLFVYVYLLFCRAINCWPCDPHSFRVKKVSI